MIRANEIVRLVRDAGMALTIAPQKFTPCRNISIGCASAALAPSGASPSGEFALGVEALDRFIKREPLRRVHECVFAVLALESESVDPRLWFQIGDYQRSLPWGTALRMSPQLPLSRSDLVVCWACSVAWR